MEYILLALFTLAAVIFIINSHYRWTYFFAIAQFVLFFSLIFSITGQWQRGLNFAAVLFVVLRLFHRLKIHFYKQPLLVSDFFLVFDWRNWETLLHYRSAIFAIVGLQADEFMQANIAMRKLSGGKLQDCQDERLLASYRHYLYQQLRVAK